MTISRYQIVVLYNISVINPDPDEHYHRHMLNEISISYLKYFRLIDKSYTNNNGNKPKIPILFYLQILNEQNGNEKNCMMRLSNKLTYLIRTLFYSSYNIFEISRAQG